ncbi:MAG TPA: NYN domain-containing protein [Bacillota bacterium]|nr:NYN domain-containing protein [Bacillota bacterium]
MNQSTERKNTVVFIDYTTLHESMRRSGVNPIEINFFPVILERLNTVYELNVIECIVYAYFDSLPDHHQTVLRQMGLTTRHLGRRERGCRNLLLSAEAITTLYENPTIDVFIIVSGDNALIPLLTAIHYKNKFTCLLALKADLDPDILNSVDFHEYLDDIFEIIQPAPAWKVKFSRSDYFNYWMKTRRMGVRDDSDDYCR